MITTNILYLDFLDIEGKKRSISIDYVRDDVTALELKEAMESIIELDVYGFPLAALAGARVVTKTIEEIHV